jgi:hypothetical protein
MRLAQTVAVDLRELYQCLDVLIAQPERRQSMGQAARAHVLARYHWKSVIHQAYDLWKELAEIAQATPHRNCNLPSITRADYVNDFRHFATEIVSEERRLHLTSAGQSACHARYVFPIYPDMDRYLNRSVLKVTLRYVKNLGFFRQCPTLADIIKKLAIRYDLSQEQTMSHILWLVKYGYLSVEE